MLFQVSWSTVLCLGQRLVYFDWFTLQIIFISGTILPLIGLSYISNRRKGSRRKRRMKIQNRYSGLKRTIAVVVTTGLCVSLTIGSWKDFYSSLSTTSLLDVRLYYPVDIIYGLSVLTLVLIMISMLLTCIIAWKLLNLNVRIWTHFRMTSMWIAWEFSPVNSAVFWMSLFRWSYAVSQRQLAYIIHEIASPISRLCRWITGRFSPPEGLQQRRWNCNHHKLKRSCPRNGGKFIHLDHLAARPTTRGIVSMLFYLLLLRGIVLLFTWDQYDKVEPMPLLNRFFRLQIGIDLHWPSGLWISLGGILATLCSLYFLLESKRRLTIPTKYEVAFHGLNIERASKFVAVQDLLALHSRLEMEGASRSLEATSPTNQSTEKLSEPVCEEQAHSFPEVTSRVNNTWKKLVNFTSLEGTVNWIFVAALVTCILHHISMAMLLYPLKVFPGRIPPSLKDALCFFLILEHVPLIIALFLDLEAHQTMVCAIQKFQ